MVGFLEPAAGVGSWKEPPLEEGVAALCTARSAWLVEDGEEGVLGR